MEVEKCLYKIHERTLSVGCCPSFMKTCFLLFLMITLFLTGVFIFGNVKYKDNNDVLLPYYNTLKQLYNNTDPPRETVYCIFVGDYKLNSSNQTNATISLVKENSTINIINSNDTNVLVSALYLKMYVAGNQQVLLLERDLRNKYNFTVISIYIRPEEFYSNDFEKIMAREIFTYETLMINQILFTFQDMNKFVKNAETLELWSFYKSDLENIQWSKEPVKAFFLRLLGVIKIIFGLFLVSNTTAIYIIMTVISAPILLLGLFECCIRIGNQNENTRLTFFKAFPWIGLYLYALHFNNKKQYCYVLMAFLFLIIVFYTLYISCILLWNTLLFNFSYKRGADQNFYGYMIFLEFSSLLFMRTRSSLRYYPPLIFFILFMYLFYVNFNGYAIFAPAFLIVIFFTLTLLSGFIAFLEIPALSWNPSFHYTPSMNKPRTLYFSMFNLSWFYDLPQIWTFFYPLHGRETFTPTEMSLVDRNYILLNQTLENAVNNPQPLNNNQNLNFAGINAGEGGGAQNANDNNLAENLHGNYDPQNNL